MARIWDPVAEDWKYGEDYAALEAMVSGQNQAPTNWWNPDGTPNLELVYSGANPGNAVYDRETNELTSGDPWQASSVYGYRPETFGTGAKDASWLTFAQKNGYPMDWRQSTPQQQTEFNDFLRATFPYESSNSFGEGLMGFFNSMPPPLKAVITGGLSEATGLTGYLKSLVGNTMNGAVDSFGVDIGLTDPGAYQAFTQNFDNIYNAATGSGLTGQALNDSVMKSLTDYYNTTSPTGGLDLGGPNYSMPPNVPTPNNPAVDSFQMPPNIPTGNNPVPPGINPATGTFITPVGAAATGASALSRLMDGTATSADYLELAGKLGSTALGVFGANSQQDALTQNADKYLALGAPYRDRLNASYQPGFTMANEPGYTDALNSTSDALLRRLSATGGNPYGNPGGMIEANKQINSSLALPALQNYRSQLGTFGQLGVNTAGASDTTAASNSGGVYDALGYGLSQFTQPQSPLNDLLKQFQNQYRLNGGTSLI